MKVVVAGRVSLGAEGACGGGVGVGAWATAGAALRTIARNMERRTYL
jgi:hypothetical protein